MKSKIFRLLLTLCILLLTNRTFARSNTTDSSDKITYFTVGVVLHDLNKNFEIVTISINNAYKVFNIYNIFNRGRPYSTFHERIWLSALPSIQYGIITDKWHFSISYDGTFFIQRPVATTIPYVCSAPNIYHRLQLYFAIPLQKKLSNNLTFTSSFGLLTKYSLWHINESYICEAPFRINYPSYTIHSLSFGLQASAMLILDRTHKQHKYNYLLKIDLGYLPIGYNASFHPLLIRLSFGLVRNKSLTKPQNTYKK